MELFHQVCLATPTVTNRGKPSRPAVLIGLGFGQLLIYAGMFLLGNLRAHVVSCIIFFFCAFILFLTSLLLVHSSSIPSYCTTSSERKGTSSSTKRVSITFILCFALCFRLIMLFSTPSLSDDIYRYLWEGRLISHGVNPYEHAPLDPSLKHLRDAKTYSYINHKEFPAIYPPLNQFIFATSVYCNPTVLTMNITFLLFDLLTIYILLLTLHTLHLEPNRIIIYAWNPLIIMEFAGSGHLDSAGICLLMLAFYLFTKGRTLSPTVVLAFAFLSKLLPLIFLPFFIIKRTLTKLGIFTFIAFILYLPFLSDIKNMFYSLLVYSQHWVFNASLYHLLLWTGFSPFNARVVSALTLLSIVMSLSIWYYTLHKERVTANALYQVGFIALGSLFLLTPVLHPWYLCWMIPFLVIHPNRAWTIFSGLVFLSYGVLKGYGETGVWKENTILKLVEYIPFYTLLLYDSVWRNRQRFKLFLRTPDFSSDSLAP